MPRAHGDAISYNDNQGIGRYTLAFAYLSGLEADDLGNALFATAETV